MKNNHPEPLPWLSAEELQELTKKKQPSKIMAELDLLGIDYRQGSGVNIIVARNVLDRQIGTGSDASNETQPDISAL